MPVLIWSILVTLVMAVLIARPPVPTRGVAVREDIFGFEMFEMSGAAYEAMLAPVAGGSLAMSDLPDGFRLFIRAGLTPGEVQRRVEAGSRVVDAHLKKERAAMRPLLFVIWAVLALLLPGLYIAGRAVLRRRITPSLRHR